jgi:CubicO group peptidase (beta-lactamase class C family)
MRAPTGVLLTLHLFATLVWFAAVCPRAAFAQTTARPGTPDARVDTIFEEFDKTTSPGCVVGVYQDDRTLYQRAYGMANLDHEVALTPESVFHVASVSKQFTAAAILLLAQDGKLSLDDDVRKYVPELPDFGHTITIRHLGHHTSGIRDQWSLLTLAGWRYSRDLITDDDVFEVLSRQKDLNFPPGERHLYSNSGYTLMAIIASRVSGKSFREFTSERIFKPLGMVNTHFRDDFSEIVKRQAYGYVRHGDTFRLSVTNFDTAGATSLLTTVGDLARWHRNFDTPTVGGGGLIAALLERGVLSSGKPVDYAFGIAHGTYRGLATVSHGGADAGYRAAFMRFPEQRFGVATLCNMANVNPTELSYRVADVFLTDKLQAAKNDEAKDLPEVTLTAEQLARYSGMYWNQANWIARRITLENGSLYTLAGSERVRLKPVGQERFDLAAGGGRMRVTFEQSAGKVRLRAGSDVLERIEPVVPSPRELEEFSGVYRSDEMDAVFRITLKNGALQLERTKLRPAPLEPVLADTFVCQPGALHILRNAAGRVTGFTLEAGRVLGVKFWKDTRPRPES